LKAEIGSWIRGGSYFITLTNKMGIGLQKDAASVQADWRRFLYLLKRNYPELTSSMEWLKVVELTKQKQPHLHLIVSGLPGGTVDRCRGRKDRKDWVQNGCFQAKESCLLHAVSKTWLATTEGASWVCDSSKVRSPSAAGNYIGKYVTKAYGETGLAELGFKRVWSSSRGYAPDLRVRLRGTVTGKWTKVEHFTTVYDQSDWLDRSSNDPDLERVGHPLVMAKYEQRERQRKIQWIEELMNELTNHQPAIDPQVRNRGQRQSDSFRAPAAKVSAK